MAEFLQWINPMLAWFDEHPMLALLIIAMVIDVATGLLRAWQDKRISSDISGKGMRRKATMLILVLMGFALERYVKIGGIAEVIAGGFCISEALSVFENAALLGVKVPSVLQNAFEQLAQKTTKADAKAKRMDVIEHVIEHLEDRRK